MTVTVTIPTTMSYDGTQHIYTDDADPTTGLDGGGHVDRMIPLVKDAVSVANYALSQATVVGGNLNDVIALEAEAEASANTATTAASSTSTLLANAGSMLGINFGSFTVIDGELTVSHLTTATPSLVNGELILTYETL